MGLYEQYSELSMEAHDVDRVITSLMEELEAINYYNQRADVSGDESVCELMIHNRDEEIEHACMLIEWLRRRMPEFDGELRSYLFTEAPITAVEEEATGEGPAAGSAPKTTRSLGIGSLRG